MSDRSHATVRDVLEALEELVDQHGHHVMDRPVVVDTACRVPEAPSSGDVVRIPMYRRPGAWATP